VAVRNGAVLAVEYGQTEETAVAMVTRSPGARRRGFLMTPAKYVTYIHESTNQHLEILIIMLTLTQLLCPVTLTFNPLTLKLIHGVLVSQGSFLPSLVFVSLFVFPLGGGTGQTDGQTDGQDQHIMGPPSRKDGPIITVRAECGSTVQDYDGTFLGDGSL